MAKESGDGGEGKPKRLEFHFPLLILKTRRGLRTLEKLGRLRATKIYGWFLLYMLPISAALGLYLIVRALMVYVSNAQAREMARSTGPLSHILIPGLNPYLPFIYGWIALALALVVHEGAHGALARAFRLPVKSSGLLFFLFVPIGAFVEIDEKELANAKFRDAARVLAAGPGSNMILAGMALGLLLLVMHTLAPVADGIGIWRVVKESPAYLAGMMPGDILRSINDVVVRAPPELHQVMTGLKAGNLADLTILRDSRTLSFTLQLATHPLNATMPFIGIDAVSPSLALKEYLQPSFNSIVIYFLIPTYGPGQIMVPFSDAMNVFYASPLGALFPILANILFWVWFVNVNLAVINALPIYPLDGGHAFRATLKAATKGRLGELMLKRIVAGVSLLFVFFLGSVIIIPYLV